MAMVDTIRKKLTEAFAPSRLVVVDESEKHRGHSGWREGGETHFRVEIAAMFFDGLSRVERQRAVYQALDAELKSSVHALALKIEVG